MNHKLLSLLQLCDPALPIGGFAHSAGLETYVQQELVHNSATALAFIKAQLEQNIFYTDAALLSFAFDAAEQNNLEDLLALDQTCHAVKLPREIREAGQKLGGRLVKLFADTCRTPLTSAFKEAVQQKQGYGHYPIVFALFANAMGIGKKDCLTGFLYNSTAAMVTNCVKLVPLGQQEGQVMLFGLLPLLDELATKAVQPDKDLIGLCCAAFDIRCMQHEHLYSRLYMS